jgi:hypothetical protein
MIFCMNRIGGLGFTNQYKEEAGVGSEFCRPAYKESYYGRAPRRISCRQHKFGSTIAVRRSSRRVFLLLPLAALLATLPFVHGGFSAGPTPLAMALPQYDSSGALLPPKDFVPWTFVGSNIGMSYDPGEHAGRGNFTTSIRNPEAFDAYKATGKFPDQTMFLLVVYQPAQKVSINKAGYFEANTPAWPFP